MLICEIYSQIALKDINRLGILSNLFIKIKVLHIVSNALRK